MVRIGAKRAEARAFMERFPKCYVRKEYLIRTIDRIITF